MRDLRKVIGHTGSDSRKKKEPEPFLLTLLHPYDLLSTLPCLCAILGSPLISMVTFTVSSQHA